jgi:hypothetical protein
MGSRSVARLADDIGRNEKKLADTVRRYVRAQLKDWRRIPWLALEADGRGGYSDSYRKAYFYGLWPILSGQGGGTLFVDCATGEIVRNVGKPAPDEEVLGYARSNLDAKKIIAYLEDRAANGDPDHMTKKELDERARWRADIAKECGLKPVCAPKGRHPIVWSFGPD